MKKIGIIGVAMMLMCMSFAMAETTVTMGFNQGSGSLAFSTSASVSGNYWDWPNEPIPMTKTAQVNTQLSNTGETHFSQTVVNYGNGEQDPNGAENEWSMKVSQNLVSSVSSGITEYAKQAYIWTVHPGWNTAYSGFGVFSSGAGAQFNGAGTDSYGVTGITQDAFSEPMLPTIWERVATDDPFASNSEVFVNPFVFE